MKIQKKQLSRRQLERNYVQSILMIRDLEKKGKVCNWVARGSVLLIGVMVYLILK